MRVKKSVGTIGVVGKRNSISIWNVALPLDVDRDQYVQMCYRTGTLSLINSNGEFTNSIPISSDNIQQVVFPLTSETIGSPVMCVVEPFHKQLFVASVYNFTDNYDNVLEGERAIIKKSDNGIAEIRVQNVGSRIIMNVSSAIDDGGEIIVNVTNRTSTGKFTMNVNGDVNINTVGTTNINTSEGYNLVLEQRVDDQKVVRHNFTRDRISTTLLTAEDEDSDPVVDMEMIIDHESLVVNKYTDGEIVSTFTHDDNFSIVGDESVLLGDGAESMVLGDTLAQLLKDLIAEVSISTTSIGPLLNAAAIAAFSNQVDNILSQYSKTQ
jgi:hypothetical protein